MSSSNGNDDIASLEAVLGTPALAQGGWLLLRATQSRGPDGCCAVLELVPGRSAVASGLGVLATVLAARLTTEPGAGMMRGRNSLLFASDVGEVGVRARRDRLQVVLVAPATSSLAAALAASTACEPVDELLREATKQMDQIALAATIALDPAAPLPRSWRLRKKPQPAPDDWHDDDDDRAADDDDDDDDSDDYDERRPPPMTRAEKKAEKDAEIEHYARQRGITPAAYRAELAASIRANKARLLRSGN